MKLAHIVTSFNFLHVLTLACLLTNSQHYDSYDSVYPLRSFVTSVLCQFGPFTDLTWKTKMQPAGQFAGEMRITHAIQSWKSTVRV